MSGVLVFGPDLIALGISKHLPAASSDFLRERHGLGLIHATITGLLKELPGDGVTLGKNIILSAAHGSPCLEEFVGGLHVVCVLLAGQGECLAGQLISVFR